MRGHVFISFAGHYRDWARALHRNLSSVLGEARVFFDEALTPGRSWVSGLEEAVAASARLVLVSGPETFASPWVRHELDGVLAQNPDWKGTGLIQVALLVDTPLPPFLRSVQHVDFRHHDAHRYRIQLRALGAALKGVEPRDVVLPEGLHIPEAPTGDLPDELRQELVQLLVPLFQKRFVRTLVERELEIPPGRLEGHASAQLAVSAALVHRRRGGSPEGHARDLVGLILGQELAEDVPALARDLRELAVKLQTLAAVEAPLTISTRPRLPKPAVLHHPTGTVPLGSELYIRRATDNAAEKVMDLEPGLVHVLGPRQSGKSSLLTRLAARARSQPDGPLVIEVNLQDLDEASLGDLRQLVFQLAWMTLDGAARDPQMALDLRHTPLTPSVAFKSLFEAQVLAHHPRGVLLAVDEVDRVLLPGGCARDFFAMLRAWHETGKRDGKWAGLRIALAFCTEAYLTLDDGGPQSPLENVGERCRLQDFAEEGIGRLMALHGLEVEPAALQILATELGGNPYLVRAALHAQAVDAVGLESTVVQARAGEGALGGHLKRHLRHLQDRPTLARAMAGVLSQGTCGDAKALRALEGAGLVRIEGASVEARYPVYADFLRPRL